MPSNFRKISFFLILAQFLTAGPRPAGANTVASMQLAPPQSPGLVMKKPDKAEIRSFLSEMLDFANESRELLEQQPIRFKKNVQEKIVTKTRSYLKQDKMDRKTPWGFRDIFAFDIFDENAITQKGRVQIEHGKFSPLVALMTLIATDLLDLNEMKNDMGKKKFRGHRAEATRRINEEILPNMRRLNIKLAYRLPTLDDWYIYVVSPYYKHKQKRVRKLRSRLHAIADYSPLAAAKMFALNGMHIRADFISEDEKVDIAASRHFLIRFVPELQKLLAKSGRQSAAEKKLETFYANALLGGLFFLPRTSGTPYRATIKDWARSVPGLKETIKTVFIKYPELSVNQKHLHYPQLGLTAEREIHTMTANYDPAVTLDDLILGTPEGNAYMEWVYRRTWFTPDQWLFSDSRLRKLVKISNELKNLVGLPPDYQEPIPGRWNPVKVLHQLVLFFIRLFSGTEQGRVNQQALFYRSA